MSSTARRMSSLSIESQGSTAGSKSPSNGSANSMFSRVKKFQICIWIIVAFTFLHLGTKPMVTPPEKMQAKNKTVISSSSPPRPTEETTKPANANTDKPDTPVTATPADNGKAPPTPAAVTPAPTKSKLEDETPPPPSTPQSSQPDSVQSPPTQPPTIKDKTTPAKSQQPAPTPLIDSSSFTIKTPAGSNNNNDDVSKSFVEQHCDLKNLKDEAWYPTGDDQWQQRAPYLIIAGTWNSGVNPLANALLSHPQINAANVHGFFLPRTFNRKFVTKSSKPTSLLSNATATDSNSDSFNIQVFAARDRMYHAIYSPSSLKDTNSSAGIEASSKTMSKSKMVAMDISPGLLFYAHATSHSVLCVSPWSKIVILLRNPVDRLYQQWLYSKTKLGLTLSLEDWVAREMKAMQSTGLIGGEGDKAIDRDAAPVSERDAWTKYQSVSSSTGAALGRSMYVLQLHDWIQTYLDAGKKPSDEIIIVPSEDLEKDPAKKYSEIIDFLGVAQLNTTKDDKNTDFLSAIAKPIPPKDDDIKPMKPETRTMLEQFFRPYNKRLAKLLKEQGFEGNWDKIWK